jgi:hypothetical protein
MALCELERIRFGDIMAAWFEARGAAALLTMRSST